VEIHIMVIGTIMVMLTIVTFKLTLRLRSICACSKINMFYLLYSATVNGQYSQ